MDDRTHKLLIANLKKFTEALYQEMPQTETLTANETYLRLAMACMQLQELAPRTNKAERERIKAILRLLKSVAIAAPFFPIELIEK